MPQNCPCMVESILVDAHEEACASCGEHVVLKLVSVVGERIKVERGNVLCQPQAAVRSTTRIKAELRIVDLPSERPIMTVGFQARMYMHLASVDCEVEKIHSVFSLEKQHKSTRKPRFVRRGDIATCTISLKNPIAADVYSASKRLG